MLVRLLSREPEFVYEVDGEYYPRLVQCKQWYVEADVLPEDAYNAHIILRDDGRLCSCIEYEVDGEVEYYDLTDEEVVEVKDLLAEHGISTEAFYEED